MTTLFCFMINYFLNTPGVKLENTLRTRNCTVRPSTVYSSHLHPTAILMHDKRYMYKHTAIIIIVDLQSIMVRW